MSGFRLSIAVIVLAVVLPSPLPCAQGARPLRIVAFGDSTTAPRKSVEKVYADRLAEAMGKEGVAVEVINAGVPGNTTEHARKRFERDVIARSPHVVILQFGIIDSAIDVLRDPPATGPRVAKGRYEENLRHFVRTLNARAVKVILMTPNPLRWTAKTRQLYGRPPYNPQDPDGFEGILPTYRAAMRQIAQQEEVPLVDVFAAFVAYGKKEGQSVDDLLLDGMHPNDEGHRIVAELLEEHLARMIGAVRTSRGESQ
jgi:lysophospholipase L1-like esterase